MVRVLAFDSEGPCFEPHPLRRSGAKNWRPCLRCGPPRSLSVAAGQDCGEVVSGGLPSPEVGGSRCAEERTPEQASGALGTYVPCRLESKQAPVQSTLSSSSGDTCGVTWQWLTCDPQMRPVHMHVYACSILLLYLSHLAGVVGSLHVCCNMQP